MTPWQADWSPCSTTSRRWRSWRRRRSTTSARRPAGPASKAAGVVVDDTAVTPRYVQGLAPERELPIIKRIAVGSLRNKLLIILPAALLLSQFAAVAADPDPHGRRHLPLPTRAPRRSGRWSRGDHEEHETPRRSARPTRSRSSRGAIRTDFILSAEIMVIALNEVADEPFVSRAIILVVVALRITALVYGVVGLIVKMDDVGLHLAERDVGAAAARRARRSSPGCRSCCRCCRPSASPPCSGSAATSCSSGVDELGWHAPYDLVHHLEEGVAGVAGIGGVLALARQHRSPRPLIGLVVGASSSPSCT